MHYHTLLMDIHIIHSLLPFQFSVAAAHCSREKVRSVEDIQLSSGPSGPSSGSPEIKVIRIFPKICTRTHIRYCCIKIIYKYVCTYDTKYITNNNSVVSLSVHFCLGLFCLALLSSIRFNVCGFRLIIFCTWLPYSRPALSNILEVRSNHVQKMGA